MSRLPTSRAALFACVALAGLAGLTSRGSAQSVQMFDEAPPLEVLRNIMVPESHGGMSRRIIIPQLPNEAHMVRPAAISTPMPSAQPSQAAPAAASMPAPAPAAMTMPMPKPMPAAAPDKPAGPGIVGFRINFAFDSDSVAPAYRSFVERIGQLMQEVPQVKLRIEGHTDATGPSDYNRDLSVRRGEAVAHYLVDHMGIAPNRLTVAGKGKSEPLVADPFNPRNRRVQFVRVN
jgi:outer membrane protein OmpA-like peptidoglycan-associated protein